jgi:Domain of unknown function (DUF1905)/Bacteriocin-protection, YdeI or OmpD-Associated
MEEFDTTIVEAERGGAFVHVPPAVVDALGGKGRIPVRATFDGVAYRGSVVSMGGGEKVLGVLKAIRTEIGKEPGDVVRVTIEGDTETRSVEVPSDLRAALETAGLVGAFAKLSYSHQREYVSWIDEAKKPETRARRITQAIDRLGA